MLKNWEEDLKEMSEIISKIPLPDLSLELSYQLWKEGIDITPSSISRLLDILKDKKLIKEQ